MKQSKKDKILDYLRAGYRLTPLEALRMFGSMRLGAVIWDLKKEGWDIQSRLVRGDSGSHYSQYWLMADSDKKGQFTFVQERII